MQTSTTSAGFVGLPNVGKSTLFNAITKSSVPAENYPFCTINPHIAYAYIPDDRLEKLQKIYQSQQQVDATVKFVDIAGLVKGAASGEGLGNQFLSHIREVDLIFHVLRCFTDEHIIHTKNEVDPLADYEIILTELIFKDIESVTKRQAKVGSLIKATKNKPQEHKELCKEADILEKIYAALNNTDQATVKLLSKELPYKDLILCAKDFLIIANISEQEIANDAYIHNIHYQTLIKKFGTTSVIPISAQLEYELSLLPDTEAVEMANMMGLEKRGLPEIIQKAYQHLGLITFFTCGPQEIHAWPIPQGITIRQAAGKIHSDLERGFICAEIFNYADIMQAGNEAKLRSTGKIRTEGQDYLVQDGDIVHIKFNV